jgi:hypothetical protein
VSGHLQKYKKNKNKTKKKKQKKKTKQNTKTKKHVTLANQIQNIKLKRIK